MEGRTRLFFEQKLASDLCREGRNRYGHGCSDQLSRLSEIEMKYGKKTKEALDGEFVKHKPLTKLTPGKAIRIYRELQGWSQSELAEKSGLRQATISGLEHDRITLGLERAKAIARALRVHPSVLAFPGWSVDEQEVA